MTIFALSTAPGRAGVAVIRMSGDGVARAVEMLTRKALPKPRRASLRNLFDPASGDTIDRGLVIWFPAPYSFTGESMAELQVHGSRAVLDAVSEGLRGFGLRMAGPGEFAKRAFENGKLDLTEAEGLADLIDAQTAAQRRQAVAQAGGALRRHYDAWRQALLRAMALVEASLDFADEPDVAEGAFGQAVAEVRLLAKALADALNDGRRGEIIRDGIRVAIVGPPNVGKSSLLNALAGRDAAIVFDEPGTTRDVIEVAVDLGGFSFVLSDTAGLREIGDAVEKEGMRRARQAANTADLVLYLSDASAPSQPAQPISPVKGATPQAKNAASDPALHLGEYISVMNKIDLRSEGVDIRNGIRISVKTGEGIDALRETLIAFAKAAVADGDVPFITRARHRQEIECAHSALCKFVDSADGSDRTELAAEHLRDAADAVGRLTGRLDVEEVLGQIFAEFCIGK